LWCVDGEMAMQPAGLSELARLSASCDDGDCSSGDRGHREAELDPEKHEQKRLNYEKVENAKNELPVVQTSLREENGLKLKHQNEAPSNGSNSLLIPDIANELKYGQDAPTGTIVRNNENDDYNYNHEDKDVKHKDNEKEKGVGYKTENVKKNKKEEDDGDDNDDNGEIVAIDLVEQKQNVKEKKRQNEAEEKEKNRARKVKSNDDDDSSRNSFHYRPTNISLPAAEANDRPLSTITTAVSIATDAQNDAVDFDKNNFIIQPLNRPTLNATKSTSESDVVEDNSPSLLEGTEIIDDSLPVPSSDGTVNNIKSDTGDGDLPRLHENTETVHDSLPIPSNNNNEIISSESDTVDNNLPSLREETEITDDSLLIPSSSDDINNAEIASNVVEDNTPELLEYAEITVNSLLTASENDEINNLIRQHTDDPGR